MTEEESELDFSDKKKKKKKKQAFKLDFDDETKTDAPESTTDEAAPAAAAAAATAAAEAVAPDSGAAANTGDEPAATDDLGFDGSKKKKKKKKMLELDEFDTPAPTTEGGEEGADGVAIEFGDPSAAPAPEGGEEGDAGEFDLTKKKKKKKPKPTTLDGEDNADGDAGASKDAWENSDRDYEYTELLERVFNIMRQKNPDLVAGKKRHFVMKPPQAMRVGTKKTAFVNFAEICKLLHRPPDHLQGFLLAELGTSGSIDGSDALVIKGRFQQKMIENVLRAYIREYVTCHTCKSPDTILAKENRLFFLQCESCGSKCSVASIKAGFQAVTGKRSELRQKQG